MAVFKHEYVSAVVDMGPITSGNVWELDIRVANRGETTEPFHVQFLGKLPDVQVIWMPEVAIGPLQIGGSGLGAEADPNFTAWEAWWARIFTTSLNLVPTMRFHVEGISGLSIPEFFVGPGDFAIFERPPVELPPIVDPGPAG